MSELEAHFGSGGYSETYLLPAYKLQENGFVMINDRPCKIVEISTGEVGEDGHAKIHIVGVHIFTQEKYEDICQSTHNMNVPNVTRKDYRLAAVEDGVLRLMDDVGEMREDMLNSSNKELADEIRSKYGAGEDFMVTVLSACGQVDVVAIKDFK